MTHHLPNSANSGDALDYSFFGQKSEFVLSDNQWFNEKTRAGHCNTGRNNDDDFIPIFGI